MADILLMTLVAIVTALVPNISGLPSFGVLEGYVPIVADYKGSGGYEKKPLTLTCAVNFTDYYKKDYGVVHAIAVTIKEKPSEYGGIKPSLLKLIGGYGDGGLTATIDIYSAVGGHVAVAFTERARPEKGCYAEDFGSFLNPKSGVGGVYHGVGYGGYGSYSGYGRYSGYGGNGVYGGYDGYGGYGGYSGYGGYGLAGIGGYYGAGYGGRYIPDDKEDYDDISGVIAKVNLSPGTVSSVTIDTLEDYSYLKELSGRGVVVCPMKAIKSDKEDAHCEGGILSCCALHYDDGEQSLSGKY